MSQATDSAPSDTETSAVALRVAEILISELKLEDVTPETFDLELDLIDELGIDSMDLTTIVLVIQDEWDITIYEDDYPELTTLQRIATYIQKKRHS